MSARSRELFGLLPVSLLITAGFTAVLITRAEEVQTVTVTYGALFLGACVLAHLFIRARLPDADPYLFPLAALLIAFGLVALAASAYVVYVLEILKFRRFRERQLRRQATLVGGEVPSDEELQDTIEREIETGEFEAVAQD